MKLDSLDDLNRRIEDLEHLHNPQDLDEEAKTELRRLKNQRKSRLYRQKLRQEKLEKARLAKLSKSKGRKAIKKRGRPPKIKVTQPPLDSNPSQEVENESISQKKGKR